MNIFKDIVNIIEFFLNNVKLPLIYKEYTALLQDNILNMSCYSSFDTVHTNVLNMGFLCAVFPIGIQTEKLLLNLYIPWPTRLATLYCFAEININIFGFPCSIQCRSSIMLQPSHQRLQQCHSLISFGKSQPQIWHPPLKQCHNWNILYKKLIYES